MRIILKLFLSILFCGNAHSTTCVDHSSERKPESIHSYETLRVKFRNICGERIKVKVCILKSNGKWYHNYSTLKKGAKGWQETSKPSESGSYQIYDTRGKSSPRNVCGSKRIIATTEQSSIMISPKEMLNEESGMLSYQCSGSEKQHQVLIAKLNTNQTTNEHQYIVLAEGLGRLTTTLKQSNSPAFLDEIDGSKVQRFDKIIEEGLDGLCKASNNPNPNPSWMLKMKNVFQRWSSECHGYNLDRNKRKDLPEKCRDLKEQLSTTGPRG